MTPTAERSPHLPLLVWESGDLYAFLSVAEAESSLEPLDVRSGIYKGYDCEGRLLTLSVTARREKLLGLLPVSRERVSVELAEESPNHRDELKDILQRFLRAAGVAADAVTSMTFDELVSTASRASKALR